MANIPPAATPTPIPAFTLVLRSPECAGSVAEACDEPYSGGVVPVKVDLVLVFSEGGTALVFVEVELLLVLSVLCRLSVLCCCCDDEAGFALEALFDPQITDLQAV